jgi:predicted nucleic acid-binding protein
MIYLDSSILVASLSESEFAHPECRKAVAKGGCTSSHAMLETFSILTGGRASARYSPAFAAMLIENNFEKHLEPVALSWSETHAILGEAQARGIRGGAIYDYLHLACARKAGVTAVLTMNVKDFTAFTKKGDPKIESPI